MGIKQAPQHGTYSDICVYFPKVWWDTQFWPGSKHLSVDINIWALTIKLIRTWDNGEPRPPAPPPLPTLLPSPVEFCLIRENFKKMRRICDESSATITTMTMNTGWWTHLPDPFCCKLNSVLDIVEKFYIYIMPAHMDCVHFLGNRRRASFCPAIWIQKHCGEKRKVDFSKWFFKYMIAPLIDPPGG